MSATADDRCKAITADGDRCALPAGEDGFCHQHDESNETVDEATESGGDEGDAEEISAGEAEADGGSQQAMAEGDDIMQIRDVVQSIGRDLIGDELDGIIGVAPGEEGWTVTVEVVERKSVPDTQDIIGRYEIDLTEDRSVSGYRRLDRYRRADTDKGGFQEFPE